MKSHPRVFFVFGAGPFPVDMLRYDSCYPCGTRDAASIALDDPTHERRRLVELLTHAERSPSARWWVHFGWQVVPESEVTHTRATLDLVAGLCPQPPEVVEGVEGVVENCADAASLAAAVDKIARAATDSLTRRWSERGHKAAPGTPNPFRPGSFAAVCWQRGRDAP